MTAANATVLASLGIGLMGARMAARLLREGYQVRVQARPADAVHGTLNIVSSMNTAPTTRPLPCWRWKRSIPASRSGYPSYAGMGKPISASRTQKLAPMGSSSSLKS